MALCSFLRSPLLLIGECDGTLPCSEFDVEVDSTTAVPTPFSSRVRRKRVCFFINSVIHIFSPVHISLSNLDVVLSCASFQPIYLNVFGFGRMGPSQSHLPDLTLSTTIFTEVCSYHSACIHSLASSNKRIIYVVSWCTDRESILVAKVLTL